MSRTACEFRHNGRDRFRSLAAFRIAPDLVDLCFTVGTIEPTGVALRELASPRRVEWARVIRNNTGRERWVKGLTVAAARVKVDEWRAKAGREGLTEQINIPLGF